MLDELLVHCRQIELNRAELKIAYRREWENSRKVERLEEQLAVARARAAAGPLTVYPA